MVIKYVEDHHIVHSPFCGEVREIVREHDYEPVGIAICVNMKPTVGHYHLTFDETYFVVDGEFVVKTYNPESDTIQEITLSANELCIIKRGVHHKVISASIPNRLCVVTSPTFKPEDEYLSDKL